MVLQAPSSKSLPPTCNYQSNSAPPMQALVRLNAKFSHERSFDVSGGQLTEVLENPSFT